MADWLGRETHNLLVAHRIRNLAKFLLIRGLFLLFLLHFIELLFDVLALVFAKRKLGHYVNISSFEEQKKVCSVCMLRDGRKRGKKFNCSSFFFGSTRFCPSIFDFVTAS